VYNVPKTETKSGSRGYGTTTTAKNHHLIERIYKDTCSSELCWTIYNNAKQRKINIKKILVFIHMLAIESCTLQDGLCIRCKEIVTKRVQPESVRLVKLVALLLVLCFTTENI